MELTIRAWSGVAPAVLGERSRLCSANLRLGPISGALFGAGVGRPDDPVSPAGIRGGICLPQNAVTVLFRWGAPAWLSATWDPHRQEIHPRDSGRAHLKGYFGVFRPFLPLCPD
jgi:hypothetical protein